MKIRVPVGFITVGILALVFAPAIVYSHSVPLRVLLGIPFLLLFPGYALLNAVLLDPETVKGPERLGISAALSIAIDGLVGVALNATSWGINVGPAVYALATLVGVLTLAGIILRGVRPGNRFTFQVELPLPDRRGLWARDRVLLSLGGLIVVGLGVLTFSAFSLRPSSPYSEFYILGQGNRADNYPSLFIISGGTVTSVAYGSATTGEPSKTGLVTLGVINHEGKDASYSVTMKMNGAPASFVYNGISVDRLDTATIRPGEVWEQQIGFAPQKAGDNQPVDFLLARAGQTEESLRLWVSAR